MDEAATAAAMLAGGTIVATVEALKSAGLPSRFARVGSVAVGIGLGVAAAAITEASIGLGAGAGFVSGILASASYEIARRKA